MHLHILLYNYADKRKAAVLTELNKNWNNLQGIDAI